MGDFLSYAHKYNRKNLSKIGLSLPNRHIGTITMNKHKHYMVSRAFIYVYGQTV